MDKREQEKMAVGQFLQRVEDITHVQRLKAGGSIAPQARIFRTLLGRQADRSS